VVIARQVFGTIEGQLVH